MQEETDNSSKRMENQERPQAVVVPLAVPKNATAFVRALYRKLQQTREAGDDAQSFTLLQQILGEAPGDRSAALLAREVGQRLYRSYGKELEKVLATGNATQITRMVNSLRIMADDAQLAELPGFEKAAAMVDQAARNRSQAMLQAAFCRMRETQDPRGREQLALGIEKFAQEKGLSLTPEHQSWLQAIHDAWKRHCLLADMRSKLAEQTKAFEDLELNARHHLDLEACEKGLKACQEAVAAMQELPEAASLLVKIETAQRFVGGTLTARRRRRTLIRIGNISTAVVVLGILATGAYAYVRASSQRDALSASRSACHVQEVQQQVADASLLRSLSLALSPSYAEEMEKAKTWLAEYERFREQLAELSPQLEAAASRLSNPDITPAQMTDGLVLLERVRDLAGRMQELYHVNPGAELEAEMGAFPAKLEEIRPSVLSRFLTPPSDVGMEALHSLYQDYAACRKILHFTDEENTQIHQAFMQAVSKKLMREGEASPMTALEAEQALADFDRYAPDMDLQPALRDALSSYATQARLFEKLPYKLADAGSLKEYIAAIEACRSRYERVNGAVPLEDLRAIEGHEDELLHRYKLAEYLKEAQAEQPSAVLQQLATVKDVYADGKPLFPSGAPEKIGALIRRVTAEARPDVWKDGYQCARQDSSVYIGSVAQEGRKAVLRATNAKGEPARKKIILRDRARASLVDVKLSGQRAAMGFVREALEEGSVTPAQLMHRVASLQDEHCPLLARAYLFGQAVEMAELMEPHLSGLAFSSTMKEDIEAFKELAGKVSLYPGCWFIMHSDKIDQQWQEFFDRIAQHDYKAEILSAVLPIIDSTCRYAGYIDEKGEIVSVRQAEDLYYIREGKLYPCPKEGGLQPYTPLFSIGKPK